MVSDREMVRLDGPLLEFVDDWTPIFADPTREYSYLAEMVSYAPTDAGAEFETRTNTGKSVRASIAFVSPEVVRFRAWLAEEPPGDSPMLVEGAHRRFCPQLRKDASGVTLDSGVLRVRVTKRPWSVTVYDACGRTLFQPPLADQRIPAPVLLPTGYSLAGGPPAERTNEGRVAFHESFSLETDEHLYGLGEQFGPFDKRGQRIVSWTRDPSGAVTSTVSYLNIPFVLSSRGYGLFIHHHSKIVYELGQPTPQSAAFRVEDPYLDYFFIYGPSPKEVGGRYGELTGRPAMPPLWSFGVWFSRCMYRDRKQVEEVVDRLRKLGIPADVVHLDPLWLEGRKSKKLDGCHFVWDEEAFPDPHGFVDWLGERGFKLSLWENPYVWTGTDMHREGVEKGYFVRATDGGLARPQENPGETVLVDFTKPEAVRWWQDKHRPYLRMGVGAFKTDYGEATPLDAVFADGRSGKQLHNLYPLLYNRAVWEVTREERGEAIVFGRSGYAGSQRYPINWTGDAPSSWGGLAATLRAGLSLSLSGIAMWSHDIGGFWNPQGGKPPDPTLYIRWAQFGLLSSHARFHGIGEREPWHFGRKAVKVVREFARLRYRLLPYIYSLAREAAESGLPLVRPLVLEYPGDPVAATADFEYLLGPYLLAVPITNAEGRCLVYLPEGDWFDWWTGEVHQGPKHMRLEVPIERIPLYVRADSVLAMAPEMDYVGQREWQPLTLQVRLASSVRAEIWNPAQPIKVEARREAATIYLSVDGPEQEYEMRFLEPPWVGDVTVVGKARLDSVETADRTTVVRLSAQGPFEVKGLVTQA